MNILITGVNGLIGKAIAHELLGGNNIIGLSRAIINKTNLPINYLSVNISDRIFFDFIKDKKIDCIVHCAASLDKNPLSEDLIMTNCMGIRNLAYLAITKKIKQFIYLSSITMIGKPVELPITEEHPVSPLIPYLTTKYFGELYLNNTLKECNVTILRIPSPIGVELSENKILPVFIKRSINNEDIFLLGKGNRIQNYIDVKDIGKAVNLAIQKNVRKVYNIAAEKSYSNSELAEICIKLNDSKSKIVYEGIDLEEENKWIVSIEKAKKDLNFHPSISLEDSIKEISKLFII